MNLDRPWATIPPTLGGRSPGLQFAAALDGCICELQDFHDNLEDDYTDDAMSIFEKYFYDIGTWFNEALSRDNNRYKKWIGRSAKCREQVQEIIGKADLAASSFRKARVIGYDRPLCRRRIHDLVIAVRNLYDSNEQRLSEETA